jgi:hypothetical protein
MQKGRYLYIVAENIEIMVTLVFIITGLLEPCPEGT